LFARFKLCVNKLSRFGKSYTAEALKVITETLTVKSVVNCAEIHVAGNSIKVVTAFTGAGI